MKLNLLPTSAARQGGSLFAWVLFVIIVAGSVFGAIRMNGQAAAALAQAKQDVAAFQQKSDDATTLSASADTIIKEASGPLLNTNLVNAMQKHIRVYPDFYDELFRYIPGYFRLTSLQAAPNDDNTCQVTMVGTVGSLHEYSDLILALMRIKGAQNVTRSGYEIQSTFVQPLDADAQHTWKIKPGEAKMTDDPIQRLDAKIAAATSTDFVGTGQFGTPGLPRTRGAMPSETLVTIGVTVTRDLMTPNPRATLDTAGAAFATAPTGAGGATAAAGTAPPAATPPAPAGPAAGPAPGRGGA